MWTQSRMAFALRLPKRRIQRQKCWTLRGRMEESDVEGWTTTNLGDDQVDALKAQIDGMIAEEITPTTEAMTPPWQNGG